MPEGESKPFKARRFYLLREQDVSGVSGVGKVAEGIEFENGMCALSFISPYPSIYTYPNARIIEEVHGHGGKTKLVYIED